MLSDCAAPGSLIVGAQNKLPARDPAETEAIKTEMMQIIGSVCPGKPARCKLPNQTAGQL